MCRPNAQLLLLLLLLLCRCCRVLSANRQRLRQNLRQLRAQLHQFGLQEEGVQKIVVRYPLMVLLNPINLAAKLEALKVGHMAIMIPDMPYPFGASAPLLTWEGVCLSVPNNGPSLGHKAANQDVGCRIMAAIRFVLFSRAGRANRRKGRMCFMAQAATGLPQACQSMQPCCQPESR